ncbi:MAG TPA: hypothetical protein VFI46_18660 [Jiangellaceae bacterium]|nr:hypothetical protein [Jiangellaceae bacterium]
MHADGLLAEHQIAGDLAIGPAGHRVGQDFTFSSGETAHGLGFGLWSLVDVGAVIDSSTGYAVACHGCPIAVARLSIFSPGSPGDARPDRPP